MLLNSEPDQLSFGFDNAGAANTIYLTENESENKLVLKITTDVADTTLTPGQLVPLSEAENATGSILYLNLLPLELSADEFSKLDCKADNWQTKLYAPSLICLTPTIDITLGNSPGDEIDINISKLTIGKMPPTSNVSLDLAYFRVPPLTIMDDTSRTSYASVVIQASPQGKRDLREDIACDLNFENYICNSIEDYDPVVNSLSLSLMHRADAPVVIAGENTVFTVSFVYAESKPGYGALTTPQIALHKMKVEHGQNASDWKITPDTDKQNPCWYLRPRDGKPIADSTKPSVHFNITNIITDFMPGPTVLTVEYKGVPGYNDGSFQLLLMKVPHVSIPSLSVTPNPSYLDEHDKAQVHVQWDVSDAGTLMLYPSHGNVTGKTYYNGDIERSTTFMLEAKGRHLAYNGNVATKSVNAVVLPQINSFKAAPAKIFHKQFSRPVKLEWNVDLRGSLSLTSSVTDRYPFPLNPAGSLSVTIDKPQMLTLGPEGDDNSLAKRNLVLSAFTMDAHVVSTPDIYLSTLVCSPSGRFVYGIAAYGSTVTIMDAFTLLPAIPRVSASGLTSGIAVSADGKLLYVASKEGVVDVFQVTESGPGKIDVKLLTQIKDFPGELYAIALSPSGDQFYAVGGTMTVYNKSAANQFTKVASVDLPGPGFKVVVSPSGEHIFISEYEDFSRIFVVARYSETNFSLIETISSQPIILDMALTHDGEHLFVCSKQSSYVAVFSAKTFKFAYSLDTLQSTLASAITASSDYVFVCCSNGVTMIGYDANSKKYAVLVKDLGLCTLENRTTCIAKKSNQVFISTGGSNLSLSTVNMITYEKTNAITNMKMQPTSALASADGKNVLIWQNANVLPQSYVSGVVVIDTSSYRFIAALESLAIYDMVYSRDNKLLYVIQGLNNTITVNAKDAGDYSDKGEVQGLTGTPMQLAASADGSSLFVSLSSANGTKNSVAIISTSGLKVTDIIQLQPATDGGVLPMVCLPDSSKVFVAQKEFLSVLENDASGYILSEKTIPMKAMLHSLTAFPDSKRIVGLDSNTNTLYDINTATFEITEIQIPAVYSSKVTGLAVSPGGSEVVLCTNDNGGLVFINAETWTPIFGRAIGQLPQCPIYLPDASQIFVTCQNGVGVMKQVQPV